MECKRERKTQRAWVHYAPAVIDMETPREKCSLADSLYMQENAHTGIPANNYYDYQKLIETGLIEAERKKAEAIWEWQKRCFIY